MNNNLTESLALKEHSFRLTSETNKVHEKGYRNRPLTEQQKASNTKKSKIRARVEHVFGFMEQSMNGLVLKSAGMVRSAGIIGSVNLTYDLFRYEQTIRLKITH